MDICFLPGKPPIPLEKEGDAHRKIKFLKHKVDRSGRDSEFALNTLKETIFDHLLCFCLFL